MIDPINVAGFAAAGLGEVARSLTEAVGNEEKQKTIRLRSQMDTTSQCIQQILFAYSEYKKVALEEKTKREGIAAWERVTLEKIKSQRKLLLSFIDRSFEERARNFEYLFSLADQAIASQNNKELSLVLEKITELAKTSPFQDLTDVSSVQAALSNPDHKWQF